MCEQYSVPQIVTQALPSTSFVIYYLLIILRFSVLTTLSKLHFTPAKHFGQFEAFVGPLVLCLTMYEIIQCTPSAGFKACCDP